MKELPIIFSPMMVRALDRKTKTRRIMNPQPGQNNRITKSGRTINITDPKVSDLCPYGQPGDRLWVREAWATSRYMDDQPPRETKNHGLPFWYAADDSVKWTGATCGGPGFTTRGKWRPSIHMPRWASRITLEITDIRVERLQDISEDDAKSEGIDTNGFISKIDGITGRENRIYFSTLWKSIHGPGSWDANPWVWVVSFRKLDA